MSETIPSSYFQVQQATRSVLQAVTGMDDVDAAKINSSTKLVGDLKLGKIDFLDLQFQIQDHADLKVDVELEKLEELYNATGDITVGQLVNLIWSKKVLAPLGGRA